MKYKKSQALLSLMKEFVLPYRFSAWIKLFGLTTILLQNIW